ncbi:hypothetical protein ANN_22303 [Periplaneta americana]|uniref:Uncharacterized protein n=1 Tax=Periplaneta americana TaxID=6978 RepID=A0ABQ8S7S0_PERAM|nr:hypothetical protein ANN_22303 [Periplaneta americana]
MLLYLRTVRRKREMTCSTYLAIIDAITSVAVNDYSYKERRIRYETCVKRVQREFRRGRKRNPVREAAISQKSRNIDNLRVKISQAFQQITPLMLQRTWAELHHRYELCRVVVITEDVQNIHLLLEYKPHIDVSLTCGHDPKLQEYCVCPQNMPQFDSKGIPNQAPETNKPMILNGSTSRNRQGSDQVSVEAKQLGHLYLSIDQETFDPSTGEPYD